MTNCDKFNEMISLMLDGELAEPQKTELEDHIAVCRQCARLYDAFASISSAIGEGLAEPPEALSARIMDSIRSRTPQPPAVKKASRAWGRLAALAACLAVAVFAATVSDILPSSVAPSDKNARAGGLASAAEQTGALSADPVQDSGIVYGTQYDTEESLNTDGIQKNGELPIALQESPHFENSPPPEEEIRASDACASLMGISAISVFEGDFETPDPEPIMTFTDEESLSIIMDMLEFSEAGDEITVSGAPLFLIEITRDDGTIYNLSVWIADGRLCCVSDADGILYVAAGDAGDLFAFIAAA